MPTFTANRVFEAYAKEFPIDPKKIAERLGIYVTELSINDQPFCSGMACVHDGKKEIKYNISEHPVRQRFTIAHELGHHLLGHTNDGHCFRDNPSDYRMENVDIKEVQANKFAAELLMPKKLIEFAIFDKNMTSISQLASAFAVSEMAMTVRLKSLGFIKG